MKFYNTLTKKIDEFIPNEEGKIGLYGSLEIFCSVHI